MDAQITRLRGKAVVLHQMHSMWRTLSIPKSVAPDSSHAPRLDEAASEISPEASNTANDAKVALEELRTAARSALNESRWSDALSLWEEFALSSPEDSESYHGRAASWRGAGQRANADGVLALLEERDGASAQSSVAYALNAQAAHDWPGAERLWGEVQARYPELAFARASHVAMLQICGRLDEAEAHAAEAVAAFPDSIDVVAQHVNVATARADWAAAQQRWEHLAQKFADHAFVANEGDGLLARIQTGMAPAEPGDVQVARARALEAVGDWPSAVTEWSDLYTGHPNELTIVIGYGQALRESGAFNKADHVLHSAIGDHPENVELRAHHAQVAAARGDWPDAARRWKKVLRDYPDVSALWGMAAHAYIESGQLKIADSLLAKAIKADGTRVELYVQHAKIAERQNDLVAAVARWEAALNLRPHDLNLRNSRGDALWQLAAAHLEAGKFEEATPPGPIVEAAAADPDAARLKRLALKFEGIGDNCEFGVVQRHLGADPIGLFRFAAIGAETLTDLVADSFQKLGDSAYLALRLTEGDEFLVTDTRGLYHMHAFVKKGSVDEVQFLKQQVARIGYLKRKLLADLAAREKIFVHKSSLSRIDDDAIRRLQSALSLSGDVTLLAIRQQEAFHPAGSVEYLGDHILVGYLSTLYDGEGSPIDYESWHSILLQAERHKARFDAKEALEPSAKTPAMI